MQCTDYFSFIWHDRAHHADVTFTAGLGCPSSRQSTRPGLWTRGPRACNVGKHAGATTRSVGEIRMQRASHLSYLRRIAYITPIRTPRLRKDHPMTIQVGEKIPSATLTHMTDKGPAPVSTDELFAGKKVVLFAVPGAFTPTCSARHLPGYVEHAADFAKKGVDNVVCLSVNDAFVMGAWGKAQNAEGKVQMLADGNGDFTKKLGLELDATKFGMGIRSQRYAAIVENGVVKALEVEEAGAFKVSAAENILGKL